MSPANLFLGPDDFRERAIDGKRFRGPFAAQAVFNGCIAFCNRPRQEVESLLPVGIALATNESSRPALHPMAFVFGEQTESAAIFGGVTFGSDLRYHEFALVVPFVTHRAEQHLHIYVPRMYSDHFRAMWTGRHVYGFGKEMARMDWCGDSFRIADAEDRLLFEAATEPTASWSPGADCKLPNFDAMRAVFGLPVIGQKPNGGYVSSYFDWRFDHAQVRPAATQVSIHAELIEGLKPDGYPALEQGIFEVRGMTWKLSWPEVCRFSGRDSRAARSVGTLRIG